MTTFSSPGQYPNSPSVKKQADSTNTIGSTNPTDVKGVINPNQKIDFSFSFSNLVTNTPTLPTLLTDPSFICDLINNANDIFNLPVCSGSQTLMAAPGPSGGFSLSCGCVDPSGSELFPSPPPDQDLSGLLNLFVIEDCLRKKANEKGNECLNNSNIPAQITGLLEEIPDEYLPVVGPFIGEIRELLNSDIDFQTKASDVASRLDFLGTAMLSLGFDLTTPINDIIADISDCQNQIANDPSLNNIPSDDIILALLSIVSNLPPLECKNGKVLDSVNCECICPSGSFECSNGECIACSGGEILIEKSQVNPDGSFSTNCSCECPEGTVRYNIPTNMGSRPGGMQMTPCVPKCPEGYIFKEIPYNDSMYPSDCTFYIDGRCYDCVCRKGPSNYWQSPTLVPEEACTGDSRPDPENECKCKCNNEKHTYHYGDSELSAGCYCGIELQLPTSKLRSAYCNNVKLPPNGDTSGIPFQHKGIRWSHELCECVCPSGSVFVKVGECSCPNPNHVWAAFSGCICPVEYQMDEAWNPWEYCNTEATGKIWDSDICQCVCPSGTNYDSNIEECVCATGATVTSPGAPSSSADCVCPSGQVITGDRESGYYCASGSYAYMSNILNQDLSILGYQYHYNVELL